MENIPKKLPDRVLHGSMLLGAVRPGWWKKIDPETLDMPLSERCVLGQVFGNFDKGMQALNLQHGFEGIAHGFQLWPRELVDSIPQWNRIWRELLDD